MKTETKKKESLAPWQRTKKTLWDAIAKNTKSREKKKIQYYVSNDVISPKTSSWSRAHSRFTTATSTVLSAGAGAGAGAGAVAVAASVLSSGFGGGFSGAAALSGEALAALSGSVRAFFAAGGCASAGGRCGSGVLGASEGAGVAATAAGAAAAGAGAGAGAGLV